MPWVAKVRSQRWLYDVLASQIKHYRPDIVLNQAMELSTHFLKELKPYTGFLVGQHAATTLDDGRDFSCYDLVISSFAPTVEWFRCRGVRAELSRLAFEPMVCDGLPNDKIYDLTFIGSLHPVHGSRIPWLEALCGKFPSLKLWTSRIDQLPSVSSIRKCHQGSAWGRDMYRILRQSKITLNHHGNVPPYANNLRLYEATGVGALLITDWKPNLEDLFELGKEVVAYRTTEECVELIRYYLERHCLPARGPGSGARYRSNRGD